MRKLVLTNEPKQTFLHIIGELELKLDLYWNTLSNQWALSVYDNSTGDPLMASGGVVVGSNLFILLPPYTLYARYVSKDGLLKDPKRDTLSTGVLFIGEASELV